VLIFFWFSSSSVTSALHCEKRELIYVDGGVARIQTRCSTSLCDTLPLLHTGASPWLGTQINLVRFVASHLCHSHSHFTSSYLLSSLFTIISFIYLIAVILSFVLSSTNKQKVYGWRSAEIENLSKMRIGIDFWRAASSYQPLTTTHST